MSPCLAPTERGMVHSSFPTLTLISASSHGHSMTPVTRLGSANLLRSSKNSWLLAVSKKALTSVRIGRSWHRRRCDTDLLVKMAFRQPAPVCDPNLCLGAAHRDCAVEQNSAAEVQPLTNSFSPGTGLVSAGLSCSVLRPCLS